MAQEDRHAFDWRPRLEQLHGKSVAETMSGAVLHFGRLEQIGERFTPFFPRRLDLAISGPEPIAVVYSRDRFELAHHKCRERTVDVLAGFLRVQEELSILQALHRAADGIGDAQAGVAEKEGEGFQLARTVLPCWSHIYQALARGRKNGQHLFLRKRQRRIRSNLRVADRGGGILLCVAARHGEFEKTT